MAQTRYDLCEDPLKEGTPAARVLLLDLVFDVELDIEITDKLGLDNDFPDFKYVSHKIA